ncbi:hypothetical protein [Saccharopolyspora sp. SCSIO 74807]
MTRTLRLVSALAALGIIGLALLQPTILEASHAFTLLWLDQF